MKYLFLLLISFSTWAENCQKIVLDESNTDYPVYASATKGLHIMFYENVKFGILSNDAVWKSHSNPNMKNHFWLFSKNFSTEDNVVGTTLILDSGKAVNLVVQQKLDASSCLIVEDSNNKSVIVADYTKAISSRTDTNSVATPLISSSYLFDKSQIQSTYDDSRFTYVQLNGFSSGEALHSVVAVTDGKKRVISNPSFDSVTNTYTLSGIHDELLFQYGSDSFAVKRL